MAGLVKVIIPSAVHRISAKNVVKDAVRLVATSAPKEASKHQYQTPPNRFRKTGSSSEATAGKRIGSMAASLASKGFLRSQKPYAPPQDVATQIREIFKEMKIPIDATSEVLSLEKKFTVLQACFSRFNHCVPNSQIYEMQTFDNIVKFYETPVDITTPLDALQRTQLPENLHIQYNYLRFHPETDTMFGGKSAFPKSSTLVTGLKYRNKYPGHTAKRSWP